AWLDHLRGSLARWSAKQFGNGASVSASAGGVRQLSPSATLTKLFEPALFALGWTGKVDDAARPLAVARHNTQRLNKLFFVTRQVRMDRYNLSNAQRSAMNSRMNDPLTGHGSMHEYSNIGQEYAVADMLRHVLLKQRWNICNSRIMRCSLWVHVSPTTLLI
ncbi:MAG: hypothetical protein MI924_13955, partial [Chloroflexales bacterium]|nr:hypothetical protein [Chloroflexales bacterium]